MIKYSCLQSTVANRPVITSTNTPKQILYKLSSCSGKTKQNYCCLLKKERKKKMNFLTLKKVIHYSFFIYTCSMTNYIIDVIFDLFDHFYVLKVITLTFNVSELHNVIQCFFSIY